MNNTISKINFQGNKRALKKEAPQKNAAGKINEEDVKTVIHKVTTPGFRKVALGVASFAAVMFATRRLAITPIRKVLYKTYPKSEEVVKNFVEKLKPDLAEIGDNLTKEGKRLLNGEKLSDFAQKIAKNDAGAKKITQGIAKAVKFIGNKAKSLTKAGLDNYNSVIDYTLASTVALLSSKGVLKFDNLSSKKKLEELLGDEKYGKVQNGRS